MTEYDIGVAFKAVENELIASMIRNMDRHRAEEIQAGYNWSMWQAEQLKSLERYRQKNRKKYGTQFQQLNREMESIIRQARQTGGMQQEIRILQAIKKGYKGLGRNTSLAPRSMTAEFFKLNDRKLEALIQATTHDMSKAETAVLRMANDQYRKTIFHAQVYANTGAGTYKKAVDMATKDMLTAGLNCVEYKNGARHTLSDYADMAIRTASKRAYLQGEGEKRQEWGISTVIMNKRGNPCPKCLPFVGKVLIDDVWSGGKKSDGPYPLMSTAIEKGLYHPRCEDSHTTYFPDISTADDTWTQEELDAIENANKQDTQKQYAKRQAAKYERLAKYSLDPENKKKYKEKYKEWDAVLERSRRDDIIKLSWPAEAVEALNQDERILSGYKTEHAILYDCSGNKLFHKKGEKHRVGFSAEEVVSMRGGVLTHNHPLGATFSEADIFMLKNAGLAEIRAVGRDGIYALRQPKVWPVEIESLEQIEEVYRDIELSLESEMMEIGMKNKLSPDDYAIMYQDKIIKALSDMFGLDYRLEVRKWK